MITAQVSMRVYSTVTGRTGNWAYQTDMVFEAAPRRGDRIVWGKPGHEISGQVRRVYFYEERLWSPAQAALGVDLEPTRTDSPGILAELEELHKDWEQFGGPWSGQE